MSTIRIPAISIRQNNRVYYVSKMKAEDIKNFTTVDRHRPELSVDHPDQGYQRVAESNRYKKFANYLIQEEHPLCPTALLFSARENDLKFDPVTSTIELDSSKRVQIIDGQHRAEGYKYAIYEKAIESLRAFEVPVIIVPAIDKVTEMTQFRVINSTQKGVRLDLVNMILTQVAERAGEDKLMDKELAKVVITRTVEILNSHPLSPWHSIIVMPNERVYSKQEIAEDPTKANLKFLRATSFMTSLRPIFSYLDDHGFLKGDVKNQASKLAEIMIDYWSAIKEIVPDAFASPADYVIQKTPGLFALHMVGRSVLRRIHMVGHGWSKSEFKRLLENSAFLSDADNWVKDDGEAAKYGSMKGFAQLALRIEEELPG